VSFDEKQSYWCFLSEEPMVSGGTSLVVMEITALLHVPVGTFFQLHGAPPHFSGRFRVFLGREFPDRWILRCGPILWPLCSSDMTALDFFF
jgi:hypothetical protein